MSIIKMIEDAETKDQMEAIGLEHLGADVDKRKGIETIRAELSELAEAQDVNAASEDAAPEENPEKQAEKTEAPAKESEPEAPPASAATQQGKPRYKGRLLKHTGTGRLLPWTAQLAKKRNMQEV